MFRCLSEQYKNPRAFAHLVPAPTREAGGAPRPQYLVLAGDIAPLHHPHLRAFLDAVCAQFARVFYVPGNHEFYGLSMAKGSAEIEALTARYAPKLEILMGGRAVEVAGAGEAALRVFGATLDAAALSPTRRGEQLHQRL